MNIQRIESVLSQIEKSGNYEDFTNLLSLEERKQFLHYIETNEEFLEQLDDKYSTLFDDDSDENLFKYCFKEEEAANIYHNEFDELGELFKAIVVCNLNLNLAKEALKKYMYDNIYIIIDVLKKFPSDEERIEFITTYLSDLTDVQKFKIYALSLEKVDFKLLCMKMYPECYDDFFLLVKNVKNDEELKKIIDFYLENFQNYRFKYEYKFEDILSELILKFNNDSLKLQYLDVFKTESYKATIIASLKNDNLKLQYLNTFLVKSYNATIIASLENDNLKLQYFNIFENEFDKTILVESLKDDNLKLQYLDVIAFDINQKRIISSINDLKIRLKALMFLDNITDYYIHADWLDEVENIDDDINKEIIKKIAEENGLNYDNLLKLFSRLGYDIRNLGDNLKKIVNLNPDEFEKVMQIIDIGKSSKLTMSDINDFLPTFYEREFRINNRRQILIFSRLQNLIQNKDKEGIINILSEINNVVNINAILEENNLNPETFIDDLLENENNEFLLNVLHKITNSYLTEMRNLYVAKRKKNAENELNLDYSYDKNYLISKLFQSYEIQDIYKLINSKINKDKLDNEQIELLNNEYLLKECLKFMKDQKNYPKTEFAKIKSKLKSLNRILNKLYEDKTLDFLGNKDDENVKLIPKPKEIESNDLFIRILIELDIDILKDKLLIYPELYDKLLNILKKYKFVSWSNTFENLLESADLSFDENDIATLINYFYSFYPKLEEKQKDGIRLSNILDELRTYGSNSAKYKYLLGKEDSDFIISNPGPNSSHLKVEERLKMIPEKVLIQFKRKFITVPPIDEDILLENGKKIHVDIGDITSAINLTYGERTGACMRIGGAGRTLFDFCLENENGFHVRLTDPVTSNFISRVSCFRNGNTVFLNQLRDSLDKNISNSDLIDAISIVAKKLVELTKESEYPIKNVIISDGYAMRARHNDKTSLNINDVKEGYNYFYSDVNSNNAIYLEKNSEIELGPEKAEKYDVLRKKIACYEEQEEIIAQIQKFNLVNGLLKDHSLGSISLLDENSLTNIEKLYIGEDFLVAFDTDGNILWKSILEREDYFREKANEEINVLINYLNEKGLVNTDNLVNEGGKTR